ncbi:MAG: glycosyltransferase family 87 protein [Hyphomonadaceae bacterium]
MSLKSLMALKPGVSRKEAERVALVIAGIVLLIFAQRGLTANGLMLNNGEPIFGDFLAFWSAGKLALAGQAAHVHDQSAILAMHREALPSLRVIFLWHHPPTFLLFVTPFALMPYPAAAILFLIATGAIYVWGARAILPDARALIFALAMPAALFHVGSVQTGLLVAGLTALALAWLDKRPIWAGVCIGLLAFKPHLAVLWPIMLALQGRWRTFGAAAATGVAFVIAAGAVFGFDAYGRFLANLPNAQSMVDTLRLSQDTMASLYANALALGAPKALALGLHGASALGAVALACLIWRTHHAGASAAALAAATCLISPYIFYYDALLFGVAIAFLAREGVRSGELIWFTLAWAVAALMLAIGKLAALPLAPLSAWALLIIAASRAGVTLPAGLRLSRLGG